MPTKLIARGSIHYTVRYLSITDTFSLECGLEITFYPTQKQAIEYAEEYDKGLQQ
jgi:hypothetical protein